MNFDVEPRNQDGAVVRMHGPLNLITAPQFRELVARIVDQDGRTRILLDMAGADFIDSTGLRALISGLKTTRLSGGDLQLTGPPPQVLTVLRMTNLEQVLLTQDTADEWFERARADASLSAA